MYWCDAGLDKIESANIDGSDRVVLSIYTVGINPFDIDIYGNTLIWSDWTYKQLIIMPNITVPSQVLLIGPSFNRPGGLHIQYGK